MTDSMATSVASSLVSKLCEYLFAPIGHQFGYVLCYKSYIEDLKKVVKELDNAREWVQYSVYEAEDAEKNIRDHVKVWLESAEKERGKAMNLLERDKSAKDACFRGWVPDPMVRHPIGREVENMTQVIKGLVEENRKYNLWKVDCGNAPTGIVNRTTSIVRSVDQNKIVLESRSSIIDNVLIALADDDLCVIGVWGLGGVGKSKLLEDVERKVRKDNLFNVVIMANVSRNPNLKKIQGEIADALGIKITNQESAHGRARCLRRKLEKYSEENILIILDNLWKKLDLKDIGIPCEDDNKVRGCKLLLSSRSRRVLTDMGSDRNILLKKLEDEEALKLFEWKAGNIVKDPQFKPRVNEVVKRCGGLPLLVVSLAKRLKDEDLAAWRNPLTNIVLDVKSLVELNYKDLQEKRIRSLFLVFALAFGRIPMRNSLIYSMGLGLFNDLVRMPGFGTIENAREQLIMDLKILRDSSLLLDSDDMEWFKMHDRFVDVAISIASTQWKALVGGRNCGFNEWSYDDLKKCTAISSLNVGVDELPEKLDCPNLKMLLLTEDNPSLKIPDSFFKSLKKLQVLDLTGLSFTSLPSSIEFLGNLKSLCLHFCHLEDVTVLEKLKGLQFLSFLHSTITRLPKEIGGLTKLRFLDLTGCTELEVIEPGVLQNLYSLEELYMEDSFDRWEAEYGPLQSNASLAELKNMKKLSTLCIAIPHSANLSRDLPFGKLKNHKIQIGDVWDWSGEYKESRTLKLKVDPSYLLEEWVQICLQMTQDLHLDGLQDGKHSIHDLCEKGFEELKHLHVQNSPSFQYVVHYTCSAFTTLESLFLLNLNSLEKICLGHLTPESFSKLKIVKVDNCSEIKYLFPLSMTRIFLQLEEIEISKCQLMQQIVADVEADEDEDDNDIQNSQFPLDVSNLKIFKVEDCQLILSIIPSNLLIKLQNLEAVTIERCQSIQEIFNLEGLTASGDVEILPRLTNLILSDLPSLVHICNWNPRKALSFQNLRTLKVQECENLRFLFSSPMAKSLEQIEEIEIVGCKLREEIMDVQEEELEESSTTNALVFPLLTSLSLEELPNLKTFSSRKYCIHCPLLTTLTISRCPKMMTFSSLEGKQKSMTTDTSLQQASGCINSHLSLPIFFTQDVLSPSLEELKLFSCGLRRIWPNELPEESFCRLASIVIEDCENLSHIFPSTLVERFQNLKMIEVLNCTSLEALIEHVMTSSTKATSGLPSLTYVKLRFCHSLRYLFTNDTARTLDKLEMLDVYGCNKMREVTVEECEEPKLKAMKFSNLRALKFCSLESLITFSSGSCACEFPALKELIVEDCNAVAVIVGGDSRRKLEGNVPTQPPLLLVKKVKFPNMESMKISHMDNLEKIWLDDLASDAFNKLKTLTVEYCKKLSFIFSSGTTPAKFRNLEKLTVTDCSSLKVVFHVQEFNFKESRSISTFQLRELVLVRLPNMMHVWSGLPQGALIFRRLRCVKAVECKTLKSLFPRWVAKSMAQLEEIDVSYCGVEEIVAEEDGDVETREDDDLFPRLTTLSLLQLPKLRSFDKNSHTSTWPNLRKLQVRHCGKMRSFSFDSETASGQGSTTSENQPGLFSLEKVIPHLEHIKFEDNNVVMMQHDIPRDGRVLVVEDAYGDTGATPWEVLADMGIPPMALKNLKRLSLIKLLPSLSTGFSSVTLFQSLTEIIVERFYGLVHLGTYSALTSLVHLTRLVLRDCDAMEDVAIDDGNVAKEISFPKLEALILDGLPSLESFSPMNCAFIFPSLTHIMVKQCPELSIFCKGALETPKLERVLLFDKDDEGRWKDDLNTTVQIIRWETSHTKFN